MGTGTFARPVPSAFVCPHTAAERQMGDSDMKIAIIGAGAMGCLFGSFFCGEHEVILLEQSPERIEALNRFGVTVEESDGTKRRFPIKAQKSGTQIPRVELVIIFVKATATEAALSANRGLIGEHTDVLTLQNGLGNDEIIGKFVEKEHIFVGTTRHNCVVTGSDSIFHSGNGVTKIGSLAGNHERAKQIVEAFAKCKDDMMFCENVHRLLWEKLFINMTLNSLSSVLECRLYEIYANPYTWALSGKIVDEAVAVAAADGEVFDRDMVLSSIKKLCEDAKNGVASMVQDRRAGRKTEIDFINGAVVKRGRKYGIPTPVNETVVGFVHAFEESDPVRGKLFE